METFKSVKEELEYITLQNRGYCSPVKVVEFAKNPETNLHSRFIWDNNKAAALYRLEQARKIIRMELTVIPSGSGGACSIITRQFVSLERDRTPENGYRLVTDVLSDPYQRELLLEQALKELISFKEKYKGLLELSKVFKAIEQLENANFSKEKVS